MALIKNQGVGIEVCLDAAVVVIDGMTPLKTGKGGPGYLPATPRKTATCDIFDGRLGTLLIQRASAEKFFLRESFF